MPLQITVILLFILKNFNVHCASKYFMAESPILCPNNNQMIAKVKNYSLHNENKAVIVQAIIEVNETLKGPIELTITLEKCNMEKTKCSNFPPFNYPDTCPILTTTFFGTKFFERIEPKLECPLKVGNYTFNKSEIDFTQLEKVPFDVGRYKVKWMFYQSKGLAKKRMVMCFGATAKIMMSSNRGRKN
uniref:CSON003136 protein n=1 Tax=Culicoides sonorensis TaxID=179676 RepID=A0A336MKP7_CULSO